MQIYNVEQITLSCSMSNITNKKVIGSYKLISTLVYEWTPIIFSCCELMFFFFSSLFLLFSCWYKWPLPEKNHSGSGDHWKRTDQRGKLVWGQYALWYVCFTFLKKMFSQEQKRPPKLARHGLMFTALHLPGFPFFPLRLLWLVEGVKLHSSLIY